MQSDINALLTALTDHAEQSGLIEKEDRIFAVNSILPMLGLEAYDASVKADGRPFREVLADIVAYAAEAGLCGGTMTERDLFDTKLMGAFMPRPSEINRTFNRLYGVSPQEATDWFYRFCIDANYIRADRVVRDEKWPADTVYGTLEITINLSKPEKDPKEIAAARLVKASGYPACMLCSENVGYAGRLDFPARQTLRGVDLTLFGVPSTLQYSPYVYYNEHCIVYNRRHVPMAIDRLCFDKLLDFTAKFPHYFVGSNADLPIVGGSILSHDHFQGGRYTFPMEVAPVETRFAVKGFEDIQTGIVRWPMSVIRLTGGDRERLAVLAEHILVSWRDYSDESAQVLHETDGTPHNTITPIARRRGALYELDLVLRNNRTTPEHPMGLFHPHEELHHIKKENIGLIEVMGLAVLPPRLKPELEALGAALISKQPLESGNLAHHADWTRDIAARHPELDASNVKEILRQEVGVVFARVLEHAGVFKRNLEGQAAFMRFANTL